MRVPIRLRLALWYAALTSLVVIAVAFSAYIVHGRSLYLDVDRALADDAAAFAPVLSLVSGRGQPFIAPVPDATTFVRLYGPDGRLLASERGEASPPPMDAEATLIAQSGPAYDALLRLLPGGSMSVAGSFATIRRPLSETRVRVYAQPVRTDGELAGYVQTWHSLQSVDRSMERFRWMLLGVGLAGVITVSVGSFAIAGAALSPVARMIEAARSIASSRDFSRRIGARSGGDELSALGATFDEMLAALEDAYRAQQRFLADAAHELRAPITAVRGNVELLAAHGAGMPEPDRREALDHLEREARRLGALIEELLALARSDAGQALSRHPVDIDYVVLEAVRDLGPGRRERVEVDALEPAVISGDADRISQLMTILLDNALRYTPDPGRIVVSSSIRGSTVRLAVRDEGIGIAPDELPYVFDRFYRSAPARAREPEGAGLGLPIARWIVQQHGGRIDIDSEPARGTTVMVELPLSDRGGAATAKTAPARQPMRGGPRAS